MVVGHITTRSKLLLLLLLVGVEVGGIGHGGLLEMM